MLEMENIAISEKLHPLITSYQHNVLPFFAFTAKAARCHYAVLGFEVQGILINFKFLLKLDWLMMLNKPFNTKQLKLIHVI